jgi:hypothetical protein
MDAALLTKLFGRDQRWHGPSTVILDAEAAYYALGQDTLLGGGTKHYAPRMISGRVLADAVCLLEDGSALLLLQQQKYRQATGEEVVKQFLMIADPDHVVAVEFADTTALTTLGLLPPPNLRPPGSGSHPGTQLRPF